VEIPRETKNHRLANGLASFHTAVDCAAANNRLKRRWLERAEEQIQVCAGIGSQYQNQVIFSTRNRGRFA
jgi:hypothetical protein